MKKNSIEPALYHIKIFLEKTYIPQIIQKLQKESPEKTRYSLKKEAKELFELFFKLCTNKTKNHSEIFLKWYLNGSFEDQTSENIRNIISFFRKYEKNIDQEILSNSKTYQDFVKDQTLKIWVYLTETMEHSLHSLLKNDNVMNNFFTFDMSEVSFQKNEIILLIANEKYIIDKEKIHIRYETLPNEIKTNLEKEILELKKNNLVFFEDYYEETKRQKEFRLKSQNLLNKNLSTLFKENNFLQNFDDLDEDLQKKIKNQSDTYKKIEERIQCVADLFQTPFALRIKMTKIQNKYLDYRILYDKTKTTPEDFEKIKKFLIPSETPVFYEYYVTPKKIISEIYNSREFLYIHCSPNKISAHQKIRLKKQFLEQ